MSSPGPTPRKRILAIELTNSCNLRCRHCPQGRVSTAEGFMDEQTLRECLQHCSGYTELNWRGEPLLHPRLLDFVRIAKQTNGSLRLGFHTNGILLTEDCFARLIDAGLDWLHVSLHTEESVRRFREAMRWNDARGAALYVYGDTDTTQEQLLALSLGLRRDEFHHDQFANWAGFLTDYRVVHADPQSHAATCPFVQQNSFLAGWDGRVSGCCWDYAGRHILGPARDFAAIEHRPPYELCKYCIWVRNYEDLPT